MKKNSNKGCKRQQYNATAMNMLIHNRYDKKTHAKIQLKWTRLNGDMRSVKWKKKNEKQTNRSILSRSKIWLFSFQIPPDELNCFTLFRKHEIQTIFWYYIFSVSTHLFVNTQMSNAIATHLQTETTKTRICHLIEHTCLLDKQYADFQALHTNARWNRSMLLGRSNNKKRTNNRQKDKYKCWKASQTHMHTRKGSNISRTFRTGVSVCVLDSGCWGEYWWPLQNTSDQYGISTRMIYSSKFFNWLNCNSWYNEGRSMYVIKTMTGTRSPCHARGVHSNSYSSYCGSIWNQLSWPIPMSAISSDAYSSLEWILF